MWLLCSSAKPRKTLCNQKNRVKKFKWTKTGYILFHSPFSYSKSQALTIFLGPADLAWKNSQYFGVNFQHSKVLVQKGIHRRVATPLGVGGPMETLLSSRWNLPSSMPSTGAKCAWKTNIDLWQSLKKFMGVFPGVYEITRNGDKSQAIYFS